MARVYRRNQPAKPEDTLLTGGEVAGLLRCSPATVRRMGLADTIRRVDVGGLVFYARDSVDRLRKGEVAPLATPKPSKPKPASRPTSGSRALRLLSSDSFQF